MCIIYQSNDLSILSGHVDRVYRYQGCLRPGINLLAGTGVLDLLISLAGEEGFEPSLTDPESAVLPLDYSPVVLFLNDLRSLILLQGYHIGKSHSTPDCYL